MSYYDAHVHARQRLIMEYFMLPNTLTLDSTPDEDAAVQAKQDELRILIQGEWPR